MDNMENEMPTGLILERIDLVVSLGLEGFRGCGC